MLESPTWRASPGWAAQLGYSPEQLDALNRKAIALMEELRAEYQGSAPIVISGCIGPEGDGYAPETMLTARRGRALPRRPDRHLRRYGGRHGHRDHDDLCRGGDRRHARGARRSGCRSVISFTVETDGRLPSGQALGGAIQQVDDATDGAPAYYMINCAHPTHFEDAVSGGEPWVQRIGGLRTNASTKSHAELDEAEELDEGDPADLAERHAALKAALPGVNVLGGCCGTDHRHVDAICGAWLADAPART